MRYWADVATSHALETRIHLESTTDGLPLRQRGLLRRLWWCCFMCDRLISLETNRMPRISITDFNISTLTENDFSIPTSTGLMETCQPQESVCSYATDLDQRQKLAWLCIAQLSLSLSLTHVFSLRNVAVQMGKSAEKGSVHRERREKHDLAFVSCIRDLLQWRKSLRPVLAYQPISPSDTGLAPASNLTVCRAALHKSYYAAFAALYRSRLLFLRKSTTAWSMEHEMCKIFMENASQRICDITRDMDESSTDCSPLSTNESFAKPLARGFAMGPKSQSQDVEQLGRESTHEPNNGLTPGLHGVQYTHAIPTTLASFTQLGRQPGPTALGTYAIPQQALFEGKADRFGCNLGVEQNTLPDFEWAVEFRGSP
jgi:hypothetical protein